MSHLNEPHQIMNVIKSKRRNHMQLNNSPTGQKPGSSEPVCALPGAPWGFIFGYLLLFAAINTSAQSFAIDWHSIDGGGGKSTNGIHTVNGTIGQADNARLAGNGFAVLGGVWSAFVTVQTPGTPVLSIDRIGNEIEITWPTDGAAGYVLQTTQSLSPGSTWSNESTPPTEADRTRRVRLPAMPGIHFYRLIQSQ